MHTIKLIKKNGKYNLLTPLEKRKLRYAIGRAWLGMSHEKAIKWCDDLQIFWDRC